MSDLPRRDGADSLQPLRSAEHTAPEDLQAATLFAKVHTLEPLPDLSVARIRRRLENQVGHERHSRFPTWLKVTVAVAASILVFETAAAATLTVWPELRHRVLTLVVAHLPMHRPAQPSISEASREPVPVPPSPVAPAPAAAPPIEPVTAAAPSPTLTPRPARHPVAPAASDGEVELYSRALSQLNVGHDPAGALGTLGVYRFRHPNGLFRREVAVAEIRADMILGRDAEALTLLDAMHEQNFDGVSQGRELGLLRVELLARSGRCKDALPAIEPYLRPSGAAGGASGAASGDRERALFARASCRAQLHDNDGSRDDLRDYLREFPHGRFASKALQAVDALP